MQIKMEQGINELKHFLSGMQKDALFMLKKVKEELSNPKLTKSKTVDEKHESIAKVKAKIDSLTSSLIALQQPVAIDLRIIIASIKIAFELERIAAHSILIIKSINVLKKVLTKERLKRKFVKLSYVKQSELTLQLFEGTVQSFNETNTLIAKGVCNTKSEVVSRSKEKIKDLMLQMSKKKMPLKAGIEFIQISKELDRIIDLSSNIAEDIIYIYESSTT